MWISDMWHCRQGLYSLSRRTSNRKISWVRQSATSYGKTFGFKLFQSLWNLASNSAPALSRRLSNFRVMRSLKHPVSRLQDYTRFGGKTSYRFVNRDPWDIDSLRQTNQLSFVPGSWIRTGVINSKYSGLFLNTQWRVCLLHVTQPAWLRHFSFLKSVWRHAMETLSALLVR